MSVNRSRKNHKTDGWWDLHENSAVINMRKCGRMIELEIKRLKRHKQSTGAKVAVEGHR